MTATFTAKALDPGTSPDLEELFSRPGGSMVRGCWCTYYRRTGHRRDLRRLSGGPRRQGLHDLVRPRPRQLPRRIRAFDARGCGHGGLCDPLWEFITQDPIVNSSPVMVNHTLYFSGTNFGAVPEPYGFELP